MKGERIDLGDNHSMVLSYYKGDPLPAAAHVYHQNAAGDECVGWIAFTGRAWANEFRPGQIATWDVTSDNPLTLTPSLLCRACGDHGFIRDGKWVRA